MAPLLESACTEPFTCIDHEDVDDDDPQKLENELKQVINLIDNLYSI